MSESARSCRMCGCTDDAACAAPDGRPCHWVEPTLCSVCAALAAGAPVIRLHEDAPAGAPMSLADYHALLEAAGQKQCRVTFTLRQMLALVALVQIALEFPGLRDQDAEAHAIGETFLEQMRALLAATDPRFARLLERGVAQGEPAGPPTLPPHESEAFYMKLGLASGAIREHRTQVPDEIVQSIADVVSITPQMAGSDLEAEHLAECSRVLLRALHRRETLPAPVTAAVLAAREECHRLLRMLA